MMDSSNTLVGAANIISKAPNNMHSEVGNQLAENHPSEHRPLLEKEESQQISSSVNDGVCGDAANQKTNLHDLVRSNDEPVSTNSIPVFVQPTSAIALNDEVADVSLNEEPRETHWCRCDEMYCHCNCGERSCQCGKSTDGYRCVVL